MKLAADLGLPPMGEAITSDLRQFFRPLCDEIETRKRAAGVDAKIIVQ